MSRSGAQRSPPELITVGDFDPGSERAIEYDFKGRTIAGRYTVRAQIGGGGMAEVFRATDEELSVDVAIKLLKPRLASDDLRARMLQEARAAAQVRHPNLVRVFSAGAIDHTAFIVMELLAGQDLEQYLCERPERRLPWREALTLLLPALEALHAVHERGYTHRDIKTTNIIITREAGHPPFAVVIDLGLVKPDRALRTADSPPTTEVGRLLCTPGYTSPEQALGLPVDRRSDVYSMAITLYRVLTGRLPFHAVHGKHVTAVLASHISAEPTLLLDAAPNAGIPPAVAAVVESALRKDPSQRPQTMLALAEALRAAIDANTDKPAPGRRRVRWLAPLILGAGCLGVGAGATWLATPRPTCDAIAVSAFGPTSAPDAPASTESARPAARDAAPTNDATPARPPPVPGRPATPATDDRAAGPPRGPDAAQRRALARHTPEIQTCADRTSISATRIRVRVTVAATGNIEARVVDAAETPLGRCVAAALRQTSLPGPAGSFFYSFNLRPRAASRP